MAKKRIQGGSKTGFAPFAWALALGGLAQILVWRNDAWEFSRNLMRGNGPGYFGFLLFLLGGFLLYQSWKRSGGEILALAGPRKLPRWAEVTGLVLIVLLSAWMRLRILDRYPNAGFRDEGENGNVSIQIMNGQVVEGAGTPLPVYLEQNTQNATGYFYPTAVFFKLFGVSITSVRFVSVFFGVLSVAAFYFLCRWLFGAPLALFLAAALACLRWHLNFSRIGFLGMMTLFLEIPVFYFLLRGLKEKAGRVVEKLHPGLFAGAVGLTVLRGFLGLMHIPYGIEALIGLFLGIPFLLYAWRVRKDPQARFLMLSALALAMAMYSYIAARLLVIIVLLVVIHAIFTEEELEPRQKRLLKVITGLAFLGLIFLVQGSSLEEWRPEGRPTHWLKTFGKILLAGGFVSLLVLFVSLKDRFMAWGKPLGLALGLGLVAAGPLFSYTLSHWKEINARSDRVSIFNDKEADRRPWGAKLKEEVALTLGMYNVRGDGNPRHNLPNEIMVNPFWASLFALSVFYCLLRWRDERSWTMLCLWQVNLLAGYYSIEAPQAYRTIGAIPAILIGVGLVLERGMISMRRMLDRDWALGVGPLLLGLLGFGAYYEIHTYFVSQPKHPGVWAEFSASEYAMGKELKARQPGVRGFARPDWADSYTFRFMTYPERNYEYFDLARHVPLKETLPGMNGYLYLLGESQKPLASILKDYYPGGEYNEKRHPFSGELLYWSYYISQADAEKGGKAVGGLTGHYYQDIPKDLNKPEEGPHWIRKGTHRAQVDPFLLFDWTVSPIPGYFSAEWTGRVMAPVSGNYMFYVDCNSYAALEIDGRKVLERPYLPPVQPAVPGAVNLGAGWHNIRVRYYEARNYSRMELWWRRPGENNREVVPSKMLSPN